MSGRNVLVSGGTGALGRAVASAFLESGDRVIAPWIVEAEARALEADQAEALASGRLVLLEADIAEAAGAATAVKAVEPLDVLVNAAGGFAGGTPVWETDLETWDAMYRINVRTAAALCRAALPGLRERGRGVVVNVASAAADARPAALAAYAASKASVAVLTQTLQREVEGSAIRINAVVPTTIDTPANRRAMPDADPSAWTTPAQIASVIRWLASDEAASVRGGLVPV